jgi:dimethyladenosine transferase 1
MDVYNNDILEFDVESSVKDKVEKKEWHEDHPPLHIVGNLPFNVSIPLLLKWLSMIPQRRGPFAFGRTQMTLTFQKEVAQRITAPPGHQQRSRLSAMVQHLCGVKWGCTLPSSVFVPRPEVDAAVLRLSPLVKPLINVDYGTVEKVVKALFQYRRKYFSKCAKLLFPDDPHLAEELITQSNIDPHLRPQQLTIKDIESLAQTYAKLNTHHKG